MQNEGSSDHRARYQGRNLFFLLSAICCPAAILFLRIVFAAAMARGRWLPWLDTAILVLFFAAQLAGAWYLRTLFPARRQTWVKVLQFAAVFVMGLLFSITGAVVLEAFGYSFFIRLRS